MRRALAVCTLAFFPTTLAARDTESALNPVTPAHSAGAVRALIEEGNQRFAQGDYEGALERYRVARGAGGSEGSAAGLGGVGKVEAAYNEAVTLHAMGEGERAQEMLRRVEAAPDAGRLAAMARYNQGVIEYESAFDDGRFDVEQSDKTIQKLRTVERDFSSAVRLDPLDHDSQRNLELTRRQIKNVQDITELSKDLANLAREIAKNLEEAADQQEAEAQQNQSDTREESAQEQRSDQEVLNIRTEQARQQLEQYEAILDAAEKSGLLDPDDSLEESLQHTKAALQDAMKAQESAQENLDHRRVEDAASHQSDAAEALRDAADRARELYVQTDDPDEEGEPGPEQDNQGEQGEQQQQGEQEQQQQEQQQQQGQSGEQQTPESAAQQQEAQLGDAGDEEQDLAAQLIEREEEMREEMRRAKGRREPVEKDW